MAKQGNAVVATSLTVRELDAWFRNTAEARYKSLGFVNKAFGKAVSKAKFDIFHVEGGGDPSVALALGATMPAGGAFGGAEPGTIHMYVEDRGEDRLVEFVAPAIASSTRLAAAWKGDLTVGHSKSAAKKLLKDFAAALPQARPVN